jgi:hypothetical protein
MLCGMMLPPAFENELLAWLDARLNERFAQQQPAVFEGVVQMVGAMLSEQLKYDGNACKQEFANEFEQLQKYVDRMQALVENLARIEAARDAPVNSSEMN